MFFAVAEDDWSLVRESCFLLAPLELGTVDPDAMQNDSELAGDSGALSSFMILSGSPPAERTASAHFCSSGCADFFHSSSCSSVIL